jgi:hypothetical protein
MLTSLLEIIELASNGGDYGAHPHYPE